MKLITLLLALFMTFYALSQENVPAIEYEFTDTKTSQDVIPVTEHELANLAQYQNSEYVEIIEKGEACKNKHYHQWAYINSLLISYYNKPTCTDCVALDTWTTNIINKIDDSLMRYIILDKHRGASIDVSALARDCKTIASLKTNGNISYIAVDK